MIIRTEKDDDQQEEIEENKNGIEMTDDFEGEMNDVEMEDQKEDDDKGNDEQESDEEELDDQKGDVDNTSGQALDKQLWSEDEGEGEDEDEEEKEQVIFKSFEEICI